MVRSTLGRDLNAHLVVLRGAASSKRGQHRVLGLGVDERLLQSALLRFETELRLAQPGDLSDQSHPLAREEGVILAQPRGLVGEARSLREQRRQLLLELRDEATNESELDGPPGVEYCGAVTGCGCDVENEDPLPALVSVCPGYPSSSAFVDNKLSIASRALFCPDRAAVYFDVAGVGDERAMLRLQ